MATYQDYQQLANAVYDKTDPIVVKNNDDTKTIWSRVIERDNPATGYYGAVYQRLDINGATTGEYILANRGTELSELNDLRSDIQMWKGNSTPAQYADAKALMERANDYLAAHSGGMLTLAGHSLGGALTQLLSIEYGNSAVTFNAYNTREILDNLKSANYDFVALKDKSANYQVQIDALVAELPGATTPDPINQQIAYLNKQKTTIDSIIAAEKLIDEYQPGESPANLTNYRIVGDPVSSYVNLPQIGEDIRLINSASLTNPVMAEEIYKEFNSDLIGKIIDAATLHSVTNFDITKLNQDGKDGSNVFIRSDVRESQMVDKFLDNFKDGKTYELDRVVGDIVRVSQDYELYFMPQGATAKPASSELIGELYDPSYQQAVFAKAGSKADIETLANELKSNGAILTTDGNQIYVSYANKTLAYEDTANLAHGGSVGADSIAGKDGTLWTKVNELSFSKDGYHGYVYTDGSGEYVLASNGNANMTAYAAATELVGKIANYLADHGGGQLDFVGFDSGGTLSQMLGVAYGGESYAFNPPSGSPALNALTEVDQVTIDDYYSQQQTILDQLADKKNPPANPAALYQQLTELQQIIAAAKTNNQLYQAYHSGNTDNLYNYVIVGDQSYQQTQLGETISIQIENKSGEFHDILNFNPEKLKSAADDIFVTTNKGSLDDKQELSLVELFKDKTKYEIDAMDTAKSQVRISQDHELYFGIISQTGFLMATGDDRSMLITEPYDKLFSNVNLSKLGSADEIDQTRQQTIDFMLSQKYSDGSSKYAVALDQTNADKQSYLVFTELPPKQELQQYDPLALDLNNDGKVTTVGLDANVLFDHDGDGVRTATGWVAPEDGLLVRDINGDGKITDGSELFGDNTILKNKTKAKNAFDALADFDSNQDGKIDSNDENAAQLRVWQDTNQDGISQANELHTLAELEISSINAHASQTGAFNQGNGNVSIGYSQFERSDGSRSVSGAFNFVGNPIKSQFSDTVDTTAVADLPTISGSGMVRDLREAAALSPELATALRNYADNQYPKDSDLENILMLWAQTGTMETIAATLKSGPHPDGARGTNLSTEEIQRLGIIEKFTGLYAGITNFSDPMDWADGVYDKRYSNQYYGIDFSASSINNSYRALLTEVEKNLALASGKDNVLNLIDYRLENGQVQQDLSRATEWIKSLDNPEFAIAQMVKLWDATNNDTTLAISAQDQTKMLLWLKDQLRTYGLDNNPYLNTKSSVLFGGENAEQFNGNSNGANNVYINGGGGDDAFYIGDVSNITEGGRGDDFISAGNKNNVYVFNRGDGRDVVVDYGGHDTIYFGEGIGVEDLKLFHEDDAVRIQIGDDSIMLYYQNLHDIYKIEQFLFADGSRRSYSELILPLFSTSGNDTITGTSESDILAGKDGDDKLIGFGGNDIFIGGRGNDSLNMDITHASATAIFNRGDGTDTIEIINHSEDGEFVLQFGEGIGLADLEFYYTSNLELIISYGDDNDSIYLHNQGNKLNDYDWLQDEQLNGKLVFADGSEVDFETAITGKVKFIGSDNGNVMSINNPKLFSEVFGGKGYDYLQDFSSGDTTYIFNHGDGQDMIWEGVSPDNINNSWDRIKFGPGIIETDIDFKYDNFQLDIVFKNSADKISIINYWQREKRIEQLEFASGHVIDLFQAVLDKGLFQTTATEGNDNLLYDINQGADINLYGGDDIIGISDNNIRVYAGAGNDLISDWGNGNQLFGEDGNDSITIIQEIDSLNKGKTIVHGGAGNDSLFSSGYASGYFYGDDGNDSLFSGTNQNDVLIGGKGDDYLSAGWGGNKTLVFGNDSGHDQFGGTLSGQDIAQFEDGIVVDDISFSKNTETGDWTITIRNSANTLVLYLSPWYGSGADNIPTCLEEFRFSDGSIVHSSDWFNTNSYVVSGSAIADTVYMSKIATGKIAALEGDDTIIDDAGHDNTYVFGVGDGKDNISESGGIDSLILRGGFSKDILLFTQNNNDLTITFKDNSSDQITINKWFAPGENQIEKLVIGTNEYSLQTLVDEGLTVKYGTSGDDVLELFNNINTVIGGGGDDLIDDNTDNYTYNHGDGKDTIIDIRSANDVIQFGSNIHASDLKYIASDVDLIIVLSNDEQITIKGYASALQRIETLKFSDGSSLNLAEQLQIAGILNPSKIITSNGDDTLWFDRGTSVNLREGNNKFYLSNQGNTTNSNIRAGAGNDQIVIEGSAASNIVSAGNGDNFVLAYGASNSITSGSGNDTLVVFSATKSTINSGNGDNKIYTSGDNTTSILSGNGADNIVIMSGNGSATISSGGGDDIINLESYQGMSTVKAGDGNDQLIGGQNIDKLYGGSGNDEILGNDGDDLIYGENGDNYLDGGNGNDIIVSRSGQSVLFGGTGDDMLSVSLSTAEKSQLRRTIFSGGKGNDIIKAGFSGDGYLYNQGDGKDIIYDYGDGAFDAENTDYDGFISGRNDVIAFGNNINPEDLTFTKSANDLIITIGNNLDNPENPGQIIIKNHFHSSNNYQIEMLTFADGSQISTASLIQINGLKGTTANDTLNGTIEDDQLFGQAGNDKLYGKDGNDLLNGGEGNDYLYGEAGNDTLIGGQGNDTLNGGAGDDNYLMSAGDGKDIINDQEGKNSISFDKTVKKEDLWFTQKGQDLVITNTQTQDVVTVKKAYAWLTGDDPYAIIRSDAEVMESIMSGKELLKITHDMARLGATPMAQSEMTASQQAEFSTIINSNWMVDASK